VSCRRALRAAAKRTQHQKGSMNFNQLIQEFLLEKSVEKSTMMKTTCLRYKGSFVTMFFDKENSLIVKLPEDRVQELIRQGVGNEFNFTKKKFKEWILIPLEHQNQYKKLITEAISFAKLS
jgi:hypothetical protein